MAELDAQLPCPYCHKVLPVPLQSIVSGTGCACPHCGKQVRFKAQSGDMQQLVTQLGSLGSDVKVKVNVKVRDKSRPWWKFW